METIKFRQVIFNDKGEFSHFHYWGFIDRMFSSPQTGGCPTISIEDAMKNSDLFIDMLDKDGNELYENDRVLLYGCSPNIGIIKYIEGEFCVWIDEDLTPFDINFFYPSSGCTLKKIGPIYCNLGEKE